MHQAQHEHTWQYKDDQDEWKVMPLDYQRFYEEHYVAGCRRLEFPHDPDPEGNSAYVYWVDFVAFTQKNTRTGKERLLRRATWVEMVQWMHQAQHEYVWQYKNDQDQWKVMPLDYQIFYEELHAVGTQQLQFEHHHGPGGASVYVYLVNFVTSTQKNITTGKERQIRRVTWSAILD